MPNIFIGIPILNRIDLLQQCVAAVDYPADIIIINNNSTDADFKDKVDYLARDARLTVLHQSRNLGVSASWNLIIKTGADKGAELIYIGSNDTVLHSGSLEAAVNFKKESNCGIWHLHAFNFFAIHTNTIEKVGWFDENFYPAYKEDQDYSYRCHLAGMQRVFGIPKCNAEHFGSATIKSNPAYAAWNSKTHAWNANYYRMKWGGDAEHEIFNNPFNKPENDLRWWPEPREAIAKLDWNSPNENLI